jgi:excisionase family DNA binding protein
MLPPVLTVADVAAMFACTEETVRDQASAGVLPGVKFGRDWVFPLEALLESINELARDQAAQRRRPAPRGATLQPVKAAAPPALPTAEPRDLRRGARRSAAPSLATTSP